MASAIDWSKINSELLDLIFKRLDLVDFIRSGAVCRSWWSTTNTSRYISAPKSHTPWLILSSPNQPEHRYVSNPVNPKSSYKFNLPNIKHHFIIGSSHGFIISVDEIAQIHATNPITGSHRLLPAITTLFCCDGAVRDPATNQISSYIIREVPKQAHPPIDFPVRQVQKFFYQKVVIFSTSSAGLITVIIHNSCNELAFALESDESWTSIDQSPIMNFSDVLFYKDLLYAVNWKGYLVAFDILNFSVSSEPVIYVNDPVLGYDSRWDQECIYLVQSPCGSDLFLIARFDESVTHLEDDLEDDDNDDNISRQTVGFKIYKLDQDIDQWSEVSSFGTDHAVVFLGFNRTVMLLAKDIPNIAVNKGDCIYFTEDGCCSRYKKHKTIDMGIFCMEDKKIVSLGISEDDLQQFSFPPPFWFTPVNK